MGPTLKDNLVRLGYADEIVRTTEISQRIRERTGHSMSRQRIASLLTANYIEPETLQRIADGLGVRVEDLTREATA